MGRKKKRRSKKDFEGPGQREPPDMELTGSLKLVNTKPNDDEKTNTSLSEKSKCSAEEEILESSASMSDRKNDKVEEENNTSPFKVSSKSHRKRKYRESNQDLLEEKEVQKSKRERKEDERWNIGKNGGQNTECGKSSRRKKDSESVGEYQPRQHSNNRSGHSSWAYVTSHRTTIPERRQSDGVNKRQRYSVYELRGRNEVLVLFRHPEEVVIWGQAAVQVVWGSVTILGYTMTHTSLERWPVYSPTCNSNLKITTLPPEGLASADLCRNAVEQYVGMSLDKDILRCLLHDVENKTVIVSFSKNDEKHFQLIKSMSPFLDLYPPPPKKDAEKDDPLRKLGIIIATNTRNFTAVEITPDMKNAQQELLGILDTGKNPVVAVCGGKSVGKSTMSRFLANTVLNCRKEVAYLECDVGQTEFTPSACVAFNIVRQPLFGPPFTHQRKPERSCFFGAVSPEHEPARYLHCLKHVYEAYRALPEKPVLIVNTMGWNKGLGLTFMADTLRMVSPTLVLQIDSSSDGRNFPPIHSQFVLNTPSWWHNQEAGCVESSTAEYQHKLLTLESPVDYRHPSDSPFKPVDHRNLTLLADLGHLYDSVDISGEEALPTLYSLRPYRVPWSAFALHVCHAAVPNSQILNALNGSVIALCHVPEDDIVETESTDLPNFLCDFPVCNCLGFGVMRSVEPEGKYFYILTAMCQTDLTKVNCLLMGAVDLPQQLLLCQPADGNSEIPFVGEPMDVIGASSVRRRRHLQRRRPITARDET